jgi:hypothetical protein
MEARSHQISAMSEAESRANRKSKATKLCRPAADAATGDSLVADVNDKNPAVAAPCAAAFGPPRKTVEPPVAAQPKHPLIEVILLLEMNGSALAQLGCRRRAWPSDSSRSGPLELLKSRKPTVEMWTFCAYHAHADVCGDVGTG